MYMFYTAFSWTPSLERARELFLSCFFTFLFWPWWSFGSYFLWLVKCVSFGGWFMVTVRIHLTPRSFVVENLKWIYLPFTVASGWRYIPWLFLSYFFVVNAAELCCWIHQYMLLCSHKLNMVLSKYDFTKPQSKMHYANQAIKLSPFRARLV